MERNKRTEKRKRMGVGGVGGSGVGARRVAGRSRESKTCKSKSRGRSSSEGRRWRSSVPCGSSGLWDPRGGNPGGPEPRAASAPSLPHLCPIPTAAHNGVRASPGGSAAASRRAVDGGLRCSALRGTPFPNGQAVLSAPHTALPPHTQHCRPQGCAAAGPGLRIAHLPTHARRGATRSPTPRGRSSPSSLQLCPTDERPQPDQQIPAAVIPSAAPPSVGTDRQSGLPPPTPSAPRVGRRDAAPLPAPGLRGGAAEGRAALTWCLVCGCALSLLGGCTCTSLCIVPMGVGWGYNEHNVSRANLWPGNKAAPEPQPSASAPPPPPPHVRADPPAMKRWLQEPHVAV